MMDDFLFSGLLAPTDFVAFFLTLDRPCSNLEETVVERLRIHVGSAGVPEYSAIGDIRYVCNCRLRNNCSVRHFAGERNLMIRKRIMPNNLPSEKDEFMDLSRSAS
jgi:hypothetical protein